MSIMQAMESFVNIKFDGNIAVATVDDSGIEARFRVIDVPSLTAPKVADEVFPHSGYGDPLLVRFERASDIARESLREQRISWSGPDGELFLFTPRLHVERQRQPSRADASGAPKQRPANYFSKRTSRVVKWLLNHPHDEPRVTSLAAELELSESTVSRAIDSLARDRFVMIIDHIADNREKRFRLQNGERLLENWARVWEAKHVASVNWDIGTWDVASTAENFLHSANMLSQQTSRVDEQFRWCLGGLSGAALVRKAVEPSSVFVWVEKDELSAWREFLMPAPGARRSGNSLLTLGLSDDPYLFRIADSRQHNPDALWGPNVSVADPVQLFLDCRRAGERGLEAAEAMKEVLALSDGARA
jgi:DNA-binding MarR family transcriptional regulator